MRQVTASERAPAQRRPAKPGRPKAGLALADLRERILDAAEARFAKQGYEAVSTRAVAREVGATAAMIHYYFNTKRELFDAVFARRANVLNQERLDAIAAYEAAGGDAVSVEGAIAAFINPVMARLASGDAGWRHYLELVAQVGNKHEWGGEVMTRSFDPVIERLLTVIRRALPAARDRDLYWAYHFLSGSLLLTLSETDRIDRLSKGVCRSTDIEAAAPRLIQFTAAGFERLCEQA